MIRRVCRVALASLLATVPSAAFATAYYSQDSVAPNTLTNWNTDPSGTGTSPADFTTAGDKFIVQTGHQMDTSAAWTVAGTVETQSGGTLRLSAASATIGGLTNNGTVSLNVGSNNRTLTLKGNLANNGTINALNSGASVTLRFSDDSVWTGSGNIGSGSSKIQLVVDTGATLDISGLSGSLLFRSGGTMSSTVNGTVIAGNTVINGNGDANHTLNFAAGSTLVTSNATGVNGTIIWAGTLNLNAASSYTFNGSTAQATGALMPATVANLTVNNPAGATLTNATTINGTLNLLAGALTTTTTLKPTVSSTGTVSATAGSVSGPLALTFDTTGAKTFPIGRSGAQRNIGFEYTALTGTSVVTISQNETRMGGTLPAEVVRFESRYWSVAESGGSGYTYNLTVDGTGFSPVGAPILLQQGTPATVQPVSFSSPNYTATGLTSTGTFTLGEDITASDRLAYTTAPFVMGTDATSGTITIQLQGPGGTPKNATSDLTVNLVTSTATGAFRDTGDTTNITSVTILTGSDSASFRYRQTVAGQPYLDAYATGAAHASQQESVFSVIVDPTVVNGPGDVIDPPGGEGIDVSDGTAEAKLEVRSDLKVIQDYTGFAAGGRNVVNFTDAAVPDLDFVLTGDYSTTIAGGNQTSQTTLASSAGGAMALRNSGSGTLTSILTISFGTWSGGAFANDRTVEACGFVLPHNYTRRTGTVTFRDSGGTAIPGASFNFTGLVDVDGTGNHRDNYFGWNSVTESGVAIGSVTIEFKDDNSTVSNTGLDDFAFSITTTPAGSYAAWKMANSTSGTIDQDHDGDGVANGIEFFLHGPVDSTGFEFLPGVTNNAGTLSITWTKGIGYTGVYGAGADYVVEVSTDLTVWSEAPSGDVQDTPGGGGIVKYTFPSTPGVKRFARLRVTGP